MVQRCGADGQRLRDAHGRWLQILAQDYFDDASQGKIALEREYQGCLGHAWAGSIAYDGGLYLCSEKDGDPNFLMGNLLSQTWKEIWQSKQRKQVIARIKTCPPACKIHRTNLALTALTPEEKFTPQEITELQHFLDILRQAGDPGGIDFI